MRTHNNKNIQQTSSLSADMDFKDYMDAWLFGEYASRVENTSLYLASYVWNSIIKPCCKYPIKLKNVNVEWLNALLAESSKHSESAGNKARELLNIAFGDAVKAGILKVNTAQYTTHYPRKEPSVKVLKKDEVKRLLEVASNSDWYLELLCGLFLGLRKGEIYGLKFTDFDMDNRILRVSRQITSNPVMNSNGKIDYTVIEKQLKTENSYRTLKVPPIIIDELHKRRVVQELNQEKYGSEYYNFDYVSCRDNGLPHSMSSFNIALTKLCKKNGIPHVSVHALRHQYATILLEKGVSIAIISALLGHASVNTTFECYCDIMEDSDRINQFMNDNFMKG